MLSVISSWSLFLDKASSRDDVEVGDDDAACIDDGEIDETKVACGEDSEENDGDEILAWSNMLLLSLAMLPITVFLYEDCHL